MKLTTLLIIGATAASASAATSVSLRNFFGATDGLPLIDNTGTVIALGELSFQAGTISADGLEQIRGLNPETDDATVTSLFTPTGSPKAPSFAGLFNGATTDADEGGALGTAGTPLYILVTRTDGDVILFDAGASFPVQVAGNAAEGLEVRDASAVLFGGGISPVVDDSNLPAPLQGNYANGLSFNTVIPEPSTSLLAGLAGLALVARRRR